MTLEDFKRPGGKFSIFAEDLNTGEVFEAVPESAIADIASEYRISKEAAIEMLSKYYKRLGDIVCASKQAIFWVEDIG